MIKPTILRNNDDIKREIKEIFDHEIETSGSYIASGRHGRDIYLFEDIPTKKLLKAVKGYNGLKRYSILGTEPVVMLYDASLLRNGKTGFILTTGHLFSSGFGLRRVSIALSEITDIIYFEKNNELRVQTIYGDLPLGVLSECEVVLTILKKTVFILQNQNALQNRITIDGNDPPSVSKLNGPDFGSYNDKKEKSGFLKWFLSGLWGAFSKSSVEKSWLEILFFYPIVLAILVAILLLFDLFFDFL